MVGRILGGRYEILEEVGKGGMAIVYKARCRLLNRIVAVKVLRDDLTDSDEFIKRFNVEAQSAASLTHPNIVSVYDVGYEKGIHYIVMEYVEGVTLKEYIDKKGKLDWHEAVNITKEICHGLGEAHKKHIVHRDIKPHNIIVTTSGAIKVTDFGIARATTTSTVRATDDVLGSVHYFSPEAARGGYVDEKSDIYSLGIVMYEMLTGKVPFTGDTPVAVAMKHIGEKPASVCEANNEVPQCVEAVVLKAMAKETRYRYQSVEELSDDLYALLKNPNLESDSIKEPIEDIDATRKITPIKEVSINVKEKNTSSNKINKESKQDEKSDKKAIFFAMITSILIVGILTVAFGFMFFGSGNSNNLKVPNIVGMTLEKAEELAKEQGFAIEILEYKESDKEDGTILEQSPNADVNVASLDKIKVIISGKDDGEIKLDDYANRTFDSVKTELEDLGIKIKRVDEASDEVEQDFVIRQNPKKDTTLKQGDTVTLYVSSGKEEEIAVPPLVGLTEANARKALEDAKLSVGSVTEKTSDKEKGIVISQSESGMVKEGTAISFVISKGNAQEPVNNTSKTKTLTIDLSSYTTPVEIKIVSGGRTVTTTTVDPTKNPEYSAILTGTGTKTFDVYINGVKAVRKEVNFD